MAASLARLCPQTSAVDRGRSEQGSTFPAPAAIGAPAPSRRGSGRHRERCGSAVPEATIRARRAGHRCGPARRPENPLRAAVPRGPGEPVPQRMPLRRRATTAEPTTASTPAPATA
ncbi:hypothetical protein GCM10009767_13200 [Kocuria aegyptia]|uniref:Uncharacterized protein n=1 Tax=Kocuria aegyptia TaxID=330943 RepID=A0ABP4WI07_9MICC